MDGFDEKKWFLYLSDHHEGPFSLAEIQEKMSGGQVSTANYVWCEGMPDWKPMTEVPAFVSLVNPGQASAPAPVLGESTSLELAMPLETVQVDAAPGEKTGTLPELVYTPPEETAPAVEASPERASEFLTAPELETASIVPEAKPDPVSSKSKPAPQPKPELQSIPAIKGEPKSSSGQKKKSKNIFAKVSGKKIFRWVTLLVMVGSGVVAFQRGYIDPVLKSNFVQFIPYEQMLGSARLLANEVGNKGLGLIRPQLAKLVEKVPALGKWISPIPSMNDVVADDYEELKAAAGAKLETPRVAVALSQTDLMAPVFHLATNLPRGASFDVIVEGVPETLLNQTSFVHKQTVTADDLIGHTVPVRYADGKVVPRGEYFVYVIESETQPENVKALLANAQPSGVKLPVALPKGAKVIAKKSYFLGGQADETYKLRLKEFHDKLRERTATELTELKQFLGTLEAQLNDSVSNFAKLRKGKSGKGQHAAWNVFHTKWTTLDGQLNESFQKWTPEALSQQYFYVALYELTRQAGQAVAQVHGVHHAYFTGDVEKSSYDIQLGQTVSQAQIAVSTLKAKIEQAEKLGTTPNGMPRREGL